MANTSIFIDLTQVISEQTPTWDIGCCFHLQVKCQYHDCVTETKFQVQTMQTPMGIGTHIDAPLHCFPGGLDIASLSIETLVVPSCVIDVRQKATQDYFVSVEDILSYETKYGKIPANSLVLVLTGWSSKWENIAEYRCEDRQGRKHFPGVSEAAALLLLERKIVGLGIDTLSPDGSHVDFPVHKILLGQGKYLLENLTQLEKLPAKGAEIIVMPMKIEGATEAPCRIVAKLESN